MTEPVSEKMLGLIYGASLHADGWRPFLDAFYQCLAAHMVVMVFRHRPYDSPLMLMVKDQRDGETDLSRTYAKVAATNPINYEAMESGKIYALRDFVPHGDLSTLPFFCEHLEPAGKSHLELIAIGPSDGIRAHLLWVRDDAKGPLDIRERAWVLSLVPHLERSMAIFGGWKLSQLVSDIGTQALDQLAFGAVALNKDGRILFCNRVADDLIDKSEDLSQVGGRLIFRRKDHAQAMRALATLIDPASDDVVLRLRLGEETVGLLARRAASGKVENAVTTVRVILYFHALTRAVRPSLSLLTKMFGLAPSEAMLAILLSEGATLREAAKELGITENSARTYSKRIFMKAGVGRQADLIRLILRSVAMFGDS